MKSLTPFAELSTMIDKLEKTTTVGYHRTYYKTQIEKAVSTFEKMGLFKYIICAPRYHQLIATAKEKAARF